MHVSEHSTESDAAQHVKLLIGFSHYRETINNKPCALSLSILWPEVGYANIFVLLNESTFYIGVLLQNFKFFRKHN